MGPLAMKIAQLVEKMEQEEAEPQAPYTQTPGTEQVLPLSTPLVTGAGESETAAPENGELQALKLENERLLKELTETKQANLNLINHMPATEPEKSVEDLIDDAFALEKPLPRATRR